MSVNKIRLCIIGARGGSKGVKNKNIRPLLGRPLIAHTVEHAIESGMFSDIAVSSDSDEIIEAAMQAGATLAIKRPAELASDTADKAPAILHCALEAEKITGKKYETFVDLDATAPLRTPQHVRDAVEMVESTDAPNIFSACHSRRSPYFNMVEPDAHGELKLCKEIYPVPVRRQDVPPTYDMNASIYAWKRNAFFESKADVLIPGTRVFIMPDYTLFDLDSEFDFQLIETLYPKTRGLS